MKVKLELIIEEDEGSILESVERIIDRAKDITQIESSFYYEVGLNLRSGIGFKKSKKMDCNEDDPFLHGHERCTICGECITCNLRPCRDGGEHQYNPSESIDPAMRNILKGYK